MVLAVDNGFALMLKINALFVFVSASHEGITTWPFFTCCLRLSGGFILRIALEASTVSCDCYLNSYK